MSGFSAAIVCTAHLRSYAPSLSSPCWMLNVMTLNVAPGAPVETLDGAVTGADELFEPHANETPSSPKRPTPNAGRIGPGGCESCAARGNILAVSVARQLWKSVTQHWL